MDQAVSTDRAGLGMRSRCAAVAATAIAALALPAIAQAHIERPSYWPDPGVDASAPTPAGGEVPEARSLASAIDGPDEVRVVCVRKSLDLAKASIRKARREGFRIRPTDAKQKLSKSEAGALRRINVELFELCAFRSIQKAVDASGNDDRIVVMPGRYIEKKSREAPTDDPACDDFELSGGRLSYEYHLNCPNDQSLIFVAGRALGETDPPDPALEDRHGIPDEGECVRCNLQIEGSGVTPNDVLLDAAKRPGKTKLRELGKPVKDVGIRVDRADGFVVSNMTFAHAHEHGVYIMETDGFLLERTKYFYNGEYGNLLFNSDHGLVDTCEGMGHGDSAVYPGSSADSGEDAADDEPVFYPDAPRTSITITGCDIHHNTLGYSGTMGNATRVTENNFWDNGTAITTDSLFAGGHPGFPQDSARFDHNDIWANNFNSFKAKSDVVPRVPVPVGVGIFIAGGNNNEIDHNRIWDNWKRGTMLLTLPDPLFGRETDLNTTSHRNRYHDNVMGLNRNDAPKPNGVDFWWDEAAPFVAPGNPPTTIMESGVEDNCWYDNGDYTSDPLPPDVAGTAQPGRLPEACDNTTDGSPEYTGNYFVKVLTELLPCEGAIGGGGGFDPNVCHWFATPPRPGAAASRAHSPRRARAAGLATTSLPWACELAGTTLACGGATSRP
jgi:hypothetical protein